LISLPGGDSADRQLQVLHEYRGVAVVTSFIENQKGEVIRLSLFFCWIDLVQAPSDAVQNVEKTLLNFVTYKFLCRKPARQQGLGSAFSILVFS
jgi:hypothetical protein